MAITDFSLPPLLMGSDRATRFDDAAVLSRAQTEQSMTNVEYRGLDTDGRFAMAYAAVRAPTITLVSSASRALRFSCEDAPGAILMVPVSGFSTARRDGRSIEWGGQGRAVYLPPGSTRGEGQAREVIGVDIRPECVQPLARTMLGLEPSAPAPIDLDGFRALRLGFGRLDLGQLFRQQIAAVDAMECDPMRLERSGLADAILRSSVMMLASTLFFEDQDRVASDGDRRVAAVCEYIDDNLRHRIALTDLERFSGLSARSLQYAFRRSTGRSPMQWVADRRLESARADLVAAKPGMTVTMIASAYFSNLGDFAGAYRRRYGETPSQTLRSAQSSRLRT